MRQGLVKAQIEAEMTSRFGAVFKCGEKLPAEFLSSGVSVIDALIGRGLPRGAITEIFGPASSGRISLLFSVLASATFHQESCALIDTSDTFDPATAAETQMDFDRLLWVRCGYSLEYAFKATDLLLQSGGFGLVALNLADVPANCLRRIISSWWFRYRRAIENTLTALVVVTPVACVRSCAAAILEVKSEGAVWPKIESSVSNNGHLSLTADREQAVNMPQLSLVADSARQGSGNSSFLTHSQLFRGIDVRVNLEKPRLLYGSDGQVPCLFKVRPGLRP